MLLINGKLYDNSETAWALEQVKNKLPITLSHQSLNRKELIDGIDKFADDVLDGVFDAEITNFLSDEYDSDLIKTLAFMLKGEQILKRVDLELGILKSLENDNPSLYLTPLGTLLHISAGNVDALPAYSVLEGLLAGNINILKLPSNDNGLSIYLLRKLIEYIPQLENYIYVFDTPSSDVKTIEALMELVHGIVVWGSDEAVKAVRIHAPINTKIIEWGHKLSFAYLYDLDISDELLKGLAKHILDTKQLLCSSCQVIYVNTEDYDIVKEFGQRFSNILASMEEEYEIPIPIQARISIELLTKGLEGIEGSDVSYRNKHSSVICVNNRKLELSLQFGNVYVKPLPYTEIVAALYSNKSYLQTVYLYPKNKETIEKFLKVGITNICDIDKMSPLLKSHDGVFPLLQYSRIVELNSV